MDVNECDKKVPIVWILGGPGSGKGTQCEKIVAKYGFTHLSTGDLLRNEVASGSSRGKDLQAIMEKGQLVSNDVMIGLLNEAIKSSQETAKGFLIDGYPREKEQGALFEKAISPVDAIVYFQAADETLVTRLLGRAVASGRADDNEQTIKLRIQTFKANNDQVLAQYPTKLKTVNAERDVNEIFNEVIGILDPLVA